MMHNGITSSRTDNDNNRFPRSHVRTANTNHCLPREDVRATNTDSSETIMAEHVARRTKSRKRVTLKRKVVAERLSSESSLSW